MTDFVTIPTKPAPTAQRQVQMIQQASSLLFRQLVAQTRATYDAFWNNPNKTPQEMFAAAGTAGGSAIQNHAAAVVMIETIKPGTLEDKYKSARLPYSVATDGTVTVTGS